MELSEAIQTRRSVRIYDGKKIERSLFDEILVDTQMAPTWKNTQTVDYIVIESPEMKERILVALPDHNSDIVSSASAVVVLTTRKGRCGFNRDGSFSTAKEDRWEMFDAGIAGQTFCLAAWARGLGTCIMGLYDEQCIEKILNIPEDRYITALIAVGYPAQQPATPTRKLLSEKVKYV